MAYLWKRSNQCHLRKPRTAKKDTEPGKLCLQVRPSTFASTSQARANNGTSPACLFDAEIGRFEDTNKLS